MNNDKFFKWAGIISPYILAFICAMVGAILASARYEGKYTAKVETIEKNVFDLEAENAAQGESIIKQDKAIYGIQKDIEYIRGAVDRIERKIDEQR